MAEVWEGTDEVLGRRVAIKALHPHLAADPAFVARFKAEAVASARVRHPSIVDIYDTVDEGGMHVIVMELLDGQTLRQVLDAHPNPPLATMVHVAAEVASALDEAHRCGIVHRDIKPANIILCDDDRVKVTDFGIAKASDGLDLTADGQVIGTMKYLAPEQVEGEPVDARTDIYALGVVLYESVCGRLPFTGDSDLAVATARLSKAPIPPRQIRPSLPRDVELVIDQALARDPRNRQQSAADVAATLRAVRIDEGDDATTILDPEVVDTEASFAASERRWLLPTVVLVIMGLALALAGVLIGQSDTGQQLFERVTDVVSGGDDEPDASSVEEPPGTDGDIAPPETTAITPAAIATFDPQGTGVAGEHDELVEFAIDGDETTVWYSERYNDTDFGLKDGVGLIVELEGVVEIATVEVRTANEAWSGAIYLAAERSIDLSGWGDARAVASDLSAIGVFDLGGAEASTVLVWFTDLGSNPDQRMQVTEIVLS